MSIGKNLKLQKVGFVLFLLCSHFSDFRKCAIEIED